MRKAFLHLAALLALSLVYLSTDLPNAECFSSGAYAVDRNATRIADSLLDEEEFLMESETSRRIMQGRPQPISTATLKKDRGACKGDVYGSCSGKPGKIVTSRKCDLQNHCGGRGS